MLLLLPPSEGKTPASDGPALDLESLTFGSGLLAARERMLAALIRVSGTQQTRALRTLKLSKSQAGELEFNQALAAAPTAPAREIYSGVLFNALGLTRMTDAQLKRANERILICSSLFGAVTPDDQLPAYRLSGDVTLPRLGKVSAYWRKHLAGVLAERTADELIVDFRSSTYVSFWPLPKDTAERGATIKIWQQGDNGQRVAVSHFNKEAKGKIIRTLTTAAREPGTVEQLVEMIAAAGWSVDLASSGTQQRVDITLVPQGSTGLVTLASKLQDRF